MHRCKTQFVLHVQFCSILIKQSNYLTMADKACKMNSKEPIGILGNLITPILNILCGFCLNFVPKSGVLLMVGARLIKHNLYVLFPVRLDQMLKQNIRLDLGTLVDQTLAVVGLVDQLRQLKHENWIYFF